MGSGFNTIVGTTDTTARVWDTRTGNEVLVLKGHKTPVTAAALITTARGS